MANDIINLLSTEWAATGIAILALSTNLRLSYSATMGQFYAQNKPIIEFVNWILYSCSIIFLSYNYSWYFLFSIFIFVVPGTFIMRILGSLILFIYLLGMPLLIIAFVITHI
tara:strand:- start:611 stop:946 length:336 start_codon:yes stop_codon:yes gene_type:complete